VEGMEGMEGVKGIEEVEGMKCQSTIKSKCSCYTANNL
jgi:hypothetical protein